MAEASGQRGPSKTRQHTWNIGYWLTALLLLVLLQDLWRGAAQVEAVPYSQFEQALAEGRIAEVTVRDHSITGRLKNSEGGKILLVANRVEPDLAARLDHHGVPYSRVVESTLLRDLLSWVVPTALFFGLWYFVIRRMAEKQGGMGGLGGFMSIGKSHANYG